MVMTLSAPESGKVFWNLRPGAVLDMGALMGTLGDYNAQSRLDTGL